MKVVKVQYQYAIQYMLISKDKDDQIVTLDLFRTLFRLHVLDPYERV